MTNQHRPYMSTAVLVVISFASSPIAGAKLGQIATNSSHS